MPLDPPICEIRVHYRYDLSIHGSKVFCTHISSHHIAEADQLELLYRVLYFVSETKFLYLLSVSI
jgi:hypothetical protein